MPEKGSDAIFVMLKFLPVWKSLSPQTGCGIIQTSALRGVKPRCSVLFPKITLTRLIRSNHLRDLLGLVLAGRYFWVQNLGSSVLYNKLNLYIVGFFLFWY